MLRGHHLSMNSCLVRLATDLANCMLFPTVPEARAWDPEPEVS